ncbi:MAG: glycerol-3-phosphate acyltransferase [Kiritimatiellia bacterium]
MGHNWPVWLGFKGGKGVATSAGVLAGAAPLHHPARRRSLGDRAAGQPLRLARLHPRRAGGRRVGMVLLRGPPGAGRAAHPARGARHPPPQGQHPTPAARRGKPLSAQTARTRKGTSP